MVVPWNEVRWNFRSTAEKADICEAKGTERRSREVTAYRSNARSERFIIECQHVCSFEGTTFNGPVAQLVRAPPCHGGGREFESHLGRFSLFWGLSSAGRASALQAEGHRFEPYRPHRFGWIPEWPKGADCKSVGTAFEGSNPSPPT